MGSDRSNYLIFQEITAISLWKTLLKLDFSPQKHYFKDFHQT
jgi:hypothetical protein